jgi:TonB family protein
MRMRFRAFRWLIAGVTMSGFGVAVWAQTTPDEVLARLKGKPLYLRGFWGENKLSFDENGKPAKKYDWVSFTEAGMDVSSVKMQGGLLHIEGQRVGLEFPAKEAPKRLRTGGKIAIDIGGGPGTDYTKALDAIFVPDLASLTPALPLYWRGYATDYFVPGENTPAAVNFVNQKQKTEGVAHIDKTVKPPGVLESGTPSYTDAARQMGLHGVVQIYLWVTENGTPDHLRIVKPLGLGLDEAALAAVVKYKFAPATQNGKPVKVDLYIDVNFQ